MGRFFKFIYGVLTMPVFTFYIAYIMVNGGNKFGYLVYLIAFLMLIFELISYFSKKD